MENANLPARVDADVRVGPVSRRRRVLVTVVVLAIAGALAWGVVVGMSALGTPGVIAAPSSDPSPEVSATDASPAPDEVAPVLEQVPAVSGTAEDRYGMFDFVWFQDGSYYFEGVRARDGAVEQTGYDAGGMVEVFYSSATSDERSRHFHVIGLPSWGVTVSHAIARGTLGLDHAVALRWVQESGASDLPGLSGSVDPTWGLPTSVVVDGREVLVITDLAEYTGPPINELMAGIEGDGPPEIVSRGFETVNAADYSAVGSAAVLDPADVPEGFVLTEVSRQLKEDDWSSSLTTIAVYRRGFDVIAVTAVREPDGPQREANGSVRDPYDYLRSGFDKAVELTGKELPALSRAPGFARIYLTLGVPAHTWGVVGDELVIVEGLADLSTIAEFAAALSE